MITLEHAKTLHQTGKLDEAEHCYQTLLAQEPHSVEALHLLGVLYAQQSQYDKALKFLKKATEQAPQSPSIYNHLGNVLKRLGYRDEAIAAFRQALSFDENFVEAYNNLGNVYFEKHDFAHAMNEYKKALSLAPEYIDAYYNLGITYHKLSQTQEAIDAFSKLLSLTPLHFGALYHLATLHMQEAHWDLAIQYFETALTVNPAHYETHLNLGHCHLQNNALDKAIEYYQNTLLVDDKNTDVLHNLAYIAQLKNNLDLAMQYYLRITTLDPNNFAAHNNLGVAFLKKQNPEFALKHFEAAQRLQPENTSLNYIINAIKQDKRLEQAPSEYIKNLFDNYATHFESHLLESLDYQVPEALFSAVKRVTTPPTSAWIIGDLGCGTGLAALPFKSYAKELIGIDLSQNMLNQAREKNFYDELHCEDIHTYLKKHQEKFDLLLAADVLVYCGKVNTLFESIKHALKPGGLFAFSVEISPDKDYAMLKSGRFSHSKNYIQRLAQQLGFSIRYQEHQTTRLQYDKPVEGLIVILQNN